MAPTKRIDETGDDDGVESADLRVPDCANPFRVSHGAAHSRGACESLTGLSGCRKNIEQGAAFSDMGYEGKSALHTDQKEPTGTNSSGDLRGDEIVPCWFVSVGLLHRNFITGSGAPWDFFRVHCVQDVRPYIRYAYPPIQTSR